MKKPTAFLWPIPSKLSIADGITGKYSITIMSTEEKPSTNECVTTKMKPSLLKTYPNAFEILKQEATGHPNGLWNQAVCFDIGIGTKQDLDLANAYYILSYVQKMLDNHEAPQDLYTSNNLQTLLLKPPTVECYKEAAGLGCPSAAYQTGLCYLNGIGTEENNELAASFFALASKLEVADAYAALGNCFLHGYGVPKNTTNATTLFCEAAKRGSPYGMCNLGIIYYNGGDISEAMKWLEKSASKGFKQAIDILNELKS